MPSTLTWLDFSDAERRRAMQIVELLAIHETRDELGLGAIRDALADAMFPGVSTVQRRARYFLIVPWIFRAAEDATSDRLTAARNAELALIGALAESEDRDGIIGLRVGTKLKQVPSMIYWSGLERWGIRRRRGTREQWARSVGGSGTSGRTGRIGSLSWWHENLVDPPPGFPTKASLTLRVEEAEYLLERITTNCPGTLLAWLVSQRTPWATTDFAWKVPLLDQLAPDHKRMLHHARHFSEAMNGAALLYNLMLAEETHDVVRRPAYEGLLNGWRDVTHEGWDVADFWTLAAEVESRYDPQARSFVDAWLDLGRAGVNPAESQEARDLVRGREHDVKRRYARLSYESARDTWRGAAGAAQLTYRWGSAQRQILDIVKPLSTGG